jgi:hypothetical protein
VYDRLDSAWKSIVVSVRGTVESSEAGRILERSDPVCRSCGRRSRSSRRAVE